jgi:hypothetical protein
MDCLIRGLFKGYKDPDKTTNDPPQQVNVCSDVVRPTLYLTGAPCVMTTGVKCMNPDSSSVTKPKMAKATAITIPKEIY